MSARKEEHSIVPAGQLAAIQPRMDVLPTESQAMLAAGSKVIYPGQGPCQISRIIKRVVDGRLLTFYHLILLDESRCELLIPVEKARAIGVRLLMKKSEIPKLLAHLLEGAKAADDWKQRAHDNARLFNSGSPFDLAEIVRSMTELSDLRKLTLGDSGALRKARGLLISEISEATGVTKNMAEEQLDQALNAKTRIGDLCSPLANSKRIEGRDE
jgi:CarD family transcriptional regulator